MAGETSYSGMNFLCEECQELFENLELFELHPCMAANYTEENAADSAESHSQPTTELNNLSSEGLGVSDSVSSNMGCQSQRAEWSTTAARHLINLYAANMAKFRSPKYKKKQVWQIISEKLRELGIHFTAAQCEGKWKSLTAAYRGVIDNNSRSGHGRKTCPFFAELSEVYGCQPNVTPTVLMDTGNGAASDVNRSRSSTPLSSSSSESQLPPSNTESRSTRPKSSASTKTTAVRPSTSGTSQSNVAISAPGDDDSNSGCDAAIPHIDVQAVRQEAKKKRKRTTDEFLSFLNEYKQQNTRMHQERMELQRETVGALVELVKLLKPKK